MPDNNVHTHVFTDTVVPPTCTEKGYTIHKCACGYEYKDSFVAEGAHQFELVQENNPTCTQKGERVLRCSRCGAAKIIEVAPLGHSWGAWVSQTLPTCTESGKQTRICSRCGETEQREISAIGHKLSKPQNSQDHKGMVECFCKNCGKTIIMPSPTIRKTKAFLFAALLPFILVVALVVTSTILSVNFADEKLPELKNSVLYSTAQFQMLRDKDTSAYLMLVKCGDYENAEELIGNFTVKFKNETSGDKKSGYSYTYDKNGKILTETYYNASADYNERYTKYVYDEKTGRLSAIDYYNGKNEYQHSKKPVCEYDDQKRLISELWDTNEYGNVEKTEFIYTDSGRKEITTYYYSDVLDTKYETTYDKNDNIVATASYYYNESGDLRSKYETSFKYDDKGNCVEYSQIYFYVPENTEHKTVGSFTYDSNGNITLEEYNADYVDYTAVFKCEYKYDEKGNLLSEKSVEKYSDEDEEYSEEYKYTYDKYGNVATVEDYEDGELYSKSTYEYDYDEKSATKETIYYDEDGDEEDTKITEYSGMVAFYSTEKEKVGPQYWL